MKVYILQPRYSMDYNELDNCEKEILKLLDLCDENADIIVPYQ